MKKVVLSVVAAIALSTSAFAADMPVKAVKAPAAAPSPWDIAFGSALMTDYVFRGITQSAHQPSVAAYFEPRYNINDNWQLYAGISGESIKFANTAAAEIDFYGGVRPTFGPWRWISAFGNTITRVAHATEPAPFRRSAALQSVCLAIRTGNVAKKNASFFEVYAKATYTIGDFAFGPTFYYSPNYANLGADGEYLSGIVKYTAPSSMALFNGAVGWYASGEFGHQWFGTSDAFYGIGPPPAVVPAAYVNGIPEPDYNTWNIGVGFTWKVFTLDLRYTDTDLSKEKCAALYQRSQCDLRWHAASINQRGRSQSNWCSARFVAKLSADLTLGSLK